MTPTLLAPPLLFFMPLLILLLNWVWWAYSPTLQMHSCVPFQLLLGFSPSISFCNIQMALRFQMFHLAPHLSCLK
jgi:hypothetical protein